MKTEPPHHPAALGRPTSRPATGGWKAALFVIGVEIAERSAFFGMKSNLITYLTGPLGDSTAAAAATVNVWSGVAFMLPLAGAFVADCYLGRYRTVLLASLLYLVGLCLLTLSSMLPTRNASECNDATDLTACTQAQFQARVFFFCSLYLVAFAQGGHRPNVQAFGADQFDENDPEERKAKSTFFNWWNFGVCTATTFTNLALYYVQDNISWTLGFGIPWILMVVALGFFLLGARFYRYHLIEDRNSFAKVWKACVMLIGSGRRSSLISAPKNEAREALLPCATEVHDKHPDYSQDESADSVGQVEQAKALLRTFPIWATCLISAVVFAQLGTLFIKQASTLDRRVGTRFQVPPAAFQSFTGISAMAFIPIYDRLIVPTARNFTGLPSGITMLQRIGTGIALSVITMVVAALVEMKRLKTARDFGLVDLPNVTIPMSVWWLIPSYVFYGLMHVLIVIGLQEFFYDQVADAMRSLGLALFSSIFGFGDLLSGSLVFSDRQGDRKQRRELVL